MRYGLLKKDNSGVSEIYSLSDYKIDNVKIRNDATFNKDYLTGRYGAIPFVAMGNSLWED